MPHAMQVCVCVCVRAPTHTLGARETQGTPVVMSPGGMVLEMECEAKSGAFPVTAV